MICFYSLSLLLNYYSDFILKIFNNPQISSLPLEGLSSPVIIFENNQMLDYLLCFEGDLNDI